MEIKSHLFEITQFCFLHSVLLFLYFTALLTPYLKKKKESIPGFLTQCHISPRHLINQHFLTTTQLMVLLGLVIFNTLQLYTEALYLLHSNSTVRLTLLDATKQIHHQSVTTLTAVTVFSTSKALFPS